MFSKQGKERRRMTMEPMLSVRDMLVTAHMAERLHEAEQHRVARSTGWHVARATNARPQRFGSWPITSRGH